MLFWKISKKEIHNEVEVTNTDINKVSNSILEQENFIHYDSLKNLYTAPNRKNGLRSFYNASNFKVVPRENDQLWQWNLQVKTLEINNIVKKAPINSNKAKVEKNKLCFTIDSIW